MSWTGISSPNLTIGPAVVKALRKRTGLAFDTHLMISPVEPLLPEFLDAGADIVTVHAEAGPHLHRSVQRIKQAGRRAGVALNPGTPASAVDAVLGDIDLVLAMTVDPGFGGQGFPSRAMRQDRRTPRPHRRIGPRDRP